MKPLISIITPCYNAAEFISETIQSIQKQSYSHWEWFIVDDCSQDDSVMLIKQFSAKDNRIKLIQLKENSGPAKARNKGIEMAKGNYMTFIDADDVWFPKFLNENLKRIEESEGFLCASYEMYDADLKNKLSTLIVPEKATYSDILKTNTIGSLTAFIDVYRLGKEFMPEIKYRQDMGLWLQYLKKIKYAEGIQESLAIYRIRKKSHSNNKFNLLKHQWFFYRKVEKLPVFKAAYFFMIWVYFGIRKYYM